MASQMERVIAGGRREIGERKQSSLVSDLTLPSYLYHSLFLCLDFKCFKKKKKSYECFISSLCKGDNCNDCKNVPFAPAFVKDACAYEGHDYTRVHRGKENMSLLSLST